MKKTALLLTSLCILLVACANPERGEPSSGGDGGAAAGGATPGGAGPNHQGDDSSGSGSGLKAETNVLQPGETARLTLDLPSGLYKVECLVDGHDDLGMEGFLEVREDAPFVREGAVGAGSEATEVAIRNFAFAPAELEVTSNTEVTWTNEDPAPHTVTAEDGSFNSGTLEPGQTFSVAVEGKGPVTYLCEIHPEMTRTIRIA